MKPIRPLVMIIGLVALACAILTAQSCSSQKPTPVTAAPVTSSLAGHAESSVTDSFLVGTLCSKGSDFECAVAPVYTHIITERFKAATQLRHGKITVNEAQAVQDWADDVRRKLDVAMKACREDQRTGACTGNLATANELLSAAGAEAQQH